MTDHGDDRLDRMVRILKHARSAAGEKTPAAVWEHEVGMRVRHEQARANSANETTRGYIRFFWQVSLATILVTACLQTAHYLAGTQQTEGATLAAQLDPFDYSGAL